MENFSLEELYRYHTLCARRALYPNKTYEEVEVIIERTIKNWKNKP